jgi:NADPH-dependent curcumin reductase CurA
VSAPAREIALRRDIDHPPRAEDFELRTAKSQTPGPGEALLRVVYLSLDPYIGSVLRGRHMGETRPRAGDVVPGRAIGEVVASNAPGLKAGDYVRAETGWRSHAIVRGEAARVVSPCDAPLAAQLGVAGMPGLTAYAGMRHLAKVAGGEHALVSSAAGGVGGAAGQIARILGAERVVGIAGSPEKCALATGAYGFDACIDYKRASWRDDLKKAFPRGIDVYFDNVGGPILEAVLATMALYGRVAVCGLIAEYAGGAPRGPRNFDQVLMKRLRIEGFFSPDFMSEGAALTARLRRWCDAGLLALPYDVTPGLENTLAAYARLFTGSKLGKVLVELEP